jgi:hypothetical protein
MLLTKKPQVRATILYLLQGRGNRDRQAQRINLEIQIRPPGTLSRVVYFHRVSIEHSYMPSLINIITFENSFRIFPINFILNLEYGEIPIIPYMTNSMHR